MVKKITFIAFLFVSTIAYAQQLPQYTQYMFTKLAYNPGYTGAGNGICVQGLVRQQWVGFKETNAEGETFNVAPETYLISVHSPIKFLRGGLGGTIVQDKIAYQNNISLNLMYAYQTTMGAGDLGIGLQLSLLNKSIDFSKYHAIDPDPLIDGSESSKGEESDMIFDMGLGLYYRVPDTYYLGLSVLQLLESKSDPDATAANLARQFNFVGGYEFTLPNLQSIDVLPSLMIKTDFASTQLDLSALLRYRNQFWGGLSYRFQDAIAIIVGMEFKNFNIGYSYDINTSAIGSWGSHEIRVGYCFKIEVDKFRKVYRNTRFL
jgi:type IX secretion system PorP/SprF family membrane protein